jgi:hypothetical protein
MTLSRRDSDIQGVSDVAPTVDVWSRRSLSIDRRSGEASEAEGRATLYTWAQRASLTSWSPLTFIPEAPT